MNTNLDAIFEDKEIISKYQNLEQEFEALTRGSRKLCTFIFPAEKLTSDDDFIEICESAQKLGLAVITQKIPTDISDPRLQFSHVFVLPNDQIWRVPAYVSLKKIFEHYGWCDGAEHFEGEIMGFSQIEIAAWIEEHRSARIGWHGKTLYAILTPNQIRDVRALGGRAFMPQSVEDSLEIFYSRSNRRVSPLVHTLLSGTGILVRFAVRDVFVRKIIGEIKNDKIDDIVLMRISSEMMGDLNSALTSEIQSEVGKGWMLCS